MTNKDLIETANRTFLANYRPAPIVLTKGQGCRVEDVDGNRFLDLCAGIAVVNVGHSHPKLVQAIADQAARLMHVSNLFWNDRSIEFADALSKRTGFSRFFFCNSGAESNETLLKLARRYHYEQGDKDRTEIIATWNSFHGRTMGALSMTGQPKYHDGLRPLVGDVSHVDYGDVDALAGALSRKTAAVILEPVQGEGGVVVPDDAYLRAARELCDKHGALLLFDEVQTGFGRTGRFLAREWSGVMPDAVALAKGIGGGFPLGAVGVSEALVNALPPGSHGTTYGGNPLACAAGLAVLEILEGEGLVARAEERGNYLHEALQALVDDPSLPAAVGTRGRGLLRGLILGDKVTPAEVLAKVREHGVLLSLAGGNVLRFSPPLCVSEEELAEGVRTVRSVLEQM